MAAVFALVIVPLIAAVGFFLGLTHAEHTAGSGAAAAMFVALAIFVAVGLLRMAREVDMEDEHA